MKKKQSINPEIFLPKQINKQDEKPTLYNIEEEFAKLKKNRNYFKSILFVLTIIGVSALTFYTIKFIQDKNNRIKIKINDFEDLNLIEVLSSVKMYEKDLSNAKTSLETILDERDNRISILTESTNNKIKLISGAGYSLSTRRKKIKALRSNLWKKTQEIKAQYVDQIKENQKKIDELTTKIESFDKNTLKQAKKNEELLSGQDKLQDLDIKNTKNEYGKKIQNLKKYYTSRIKNIEDYSDQLSEQLTLKYNPIIEDEEIKDILGETVNNQNIQENVELKKYQDKKVIDKDLYSSIIEYDKKLNLLLSVLSNIPFKNSMPKLIKKIELLKIEIVNNYEQIGLELANNNISLSQKVEDLSSDKAKLSNQVTTLSEKSEERDKYVKAIQQLLTRSNSSGYIIEANDSNNILFILKKGLQINDNQQAEVWTVEPSKAIAKITFYHEGGLLKAKIISLYGDDKIEPMNTIKLEE